MIGIENQSDIHYCMPVRCFVYDALNYEDQRMQIKRQHDRKKDLSGAEFLGGFAKTDRLIPVFTIVVYFGDEPWDGPRSLHEMLELPTELQQYREKIADYHLNLLDVGQMETLDQYEGELKAFFGFLKYRKDKVALNEFVQENQEIFEDLSAESMQAISIMAEIGDVQTYCNHRKTTEETKGGINMCTAWEEIKADEREAGRQEGRQMAIFAVIADNTDEGRSRETIAAKLQKYCSLSEMQAAEYINQYFAEA